MEATLKFVIPSLGELRIAKMLFDLISSKLSNALKQLAPASVHSNLENSELTTSQCLLLAILRSLQTGDVPFCTFLLQLPIINNLKSSYISIWLRDEFNFDELEVVKALSLAAQLVHTGCLNIPEHILRLLAGLATKYHVFEHCRKSGDLDTINLLMELNTPISRGQQTDDISTSLSVRPSASKNSVTMTVNDDTSGASSIEANLESEAICVENEARGNGQTSSFQISEVEGAVGGVLTENEPSSSVVQSSISKEGCIGAASMQCIEIMNSPSPEDLDGIEGGFVVIEEEEAAGFSSSERSEPTQSFEGLSEDLIRISRQQRTGMEGLCGYRENREQDLIPIIRPRPAIQVNLTPRDIAVIQHYVWSPGASQAELVMLATNKRDYMGNTLLHRAAEKGRWLDVRTLVKLRDMVDLRNDLCKTPAHLAAASGSSESLQILVEHGASLSATTNEGFTPLHEAAKHGHTEVVRWLLDMGADMEVRDRQGQTAMHIAVIWCRLETVDALLNRGAHINLRNVKGQTPLALAALSRRRKIRALLKSKGGIK